MKKGILILSLSLNGVLITLYFITSADTSPVTIQKGQKGATEKAGGRTLSHRESLNNAKDSINAYVDSFPHMVQAFTISSWDMLKVMGLNPVVYNDSCQFTSCRAYLGLGNSGDFKLYLTPVRNNKDYFWYGDDPRHLQVSDTVKENSIVFDLIAPCPKTCDIYSPLYIK